MKGYGDMEHQTQAHRDARAVSWGDAQASLERMVRTFDLKSSNDGMSRLTYLVGGLEGFREKIELYVMNK